jgi:hypothetical protein
MTGSETSAINTDKRAGNFMQHQKLFDSLMIIIYHCPLWWGPAAFREYYVQED